MPTTYLVLEPVVLIADDLALMIRDAEPDAAVVCVATAEEAAEAAARLGSVGIAFLDLPPSQVVATLLSAALAGAGAQVVFLGYDLEARDMGFRYLESPFAGEAVAAELARLRGPGAGLSRAGDAVRP